MVNEILRYFGFNEEALYAEAITNLPEIFLDVVSMGLKPPVNPNIVYEGSMGRSNRIQRPGAYIPAGPINFAVDVESIGWFFKWALGGYVFTAGDPTPNIHEFYGSDTRLLKSFAAYLGKDLFEQRMQGCKVNNLAVQCGNEFVMANIDVISQKDSGSTAWMRDKTTLTKPEAPPFAFHEVTHKINGSLMDETIKDVNLQFGNNISQDTTVGHGSRFVKELPANERTASINLTSSVEDLTRLQAYWGAATGPSDSGATEFSYETILNISGIGNISCYYPKCIFQDVPLDPTGKQDMQPTLVIQPLADVITLSDEETEIESECLITIENEVGQYVLT